MLILNGSPPVYEGRISENLFQDHGSVGFILQMQIGAVGLFFLLQVAYTCLQVSSV